MTHVEYLASLLDWLGIGHQNIPTRYLCLDLETTGLDFSFLEKWKSGADLSRPVGDLILQYSLLEVDGASIVSQECYFLDWSRRLGSQAEEIIAPKIERLRSVMESKQSVYPITMEALCQGIDPIEGLTRIKSKLSSWLKSGGWLAGVNICQFDINVLRNAMGEWLNIYFDIALDRIFDPGCIMKAWQARIIPSADEKCLGHFLCRVATERCPGIRWGVDYLIDKFDLRPQLESTRQMPHSADTDCLITYWVIEKLRQEMEDHVARSARHHRSRSIPYIS